MCMPSVWITDNSIEEKLFEEIATLKIVDNNIVISTFFGEEKKIDAVIEKIDFVNSKVFLKKTI